jgi:PD-(D/E)XK nuclease superfamily protein
MREMEDLNHEDHEGQEETSSILSPRHRMQLPSPLTAEAERVMSETIGCPIRVHRMLGLGFLESIYRKAMYVELGASGLLYESERPVPVKYRDVEIAGQRST